MQLLKEVQGKPVAILLAGAPGAGKGSILKDLDLSGLKTLNLDDTIAALSKTDGFTLNQKAADAEDRSKFMKAMQAATKKLKGDPKTGIKGDLPQTIENQESFILDGTSASKNQTIKLLNQLKQSGYDVLMLYVYTDLETSLKRNQNRFETSNILKTYVDPFKVKDGKPKTDKELARSRAQKEKLNQEIQAILQSDEVQNIINSSVSKEEAQSKINTFLK